MLSRLASAGLAVQAAPLLRAALAAAATSLAPTAARVLQQQQVRECMTHHNMRTAPEMDPRVRAACSSAAPMTANTPLPVVHSDDNVAACGELPHSAYEQVYGGLWQHGEAHNIVFSDDHASITNELEKLLMVADELGGPEAVFKVFEMFGDAPEWTEMNVATVFRCLAREAARMSEAAVQREILQHPCFRRLVDAASRRAVEMSDAELAEVGSACMGLRMAESALVQQVHWRELNNCGALGGSAEGSTAATAECMNGAY